MQKYKRKHNSGLSQAKEYLELMQFELALKFCKRATEVDSENCTAFEMLGSLCMELGDLDTAREVKSYDAK